MIQTLLALTTRPTFSFSNLVIHEGNQEAAIVLRQTYGKSKKSYPYLFLHGAEGSGKTHILHAVAESIRGIYSMSPVFVNFSDLSSFEQLEILIQRPDTEMPPAVAIDDIHLVTTDQSGTLWTIINKLTRCGACLITTSRLGPSDIFPTNPHLQSRVLSGLVFGVKGPDDNARMLVLDKISADKQIRISRDVYNFLARRKTRNVKDLARLLDALDAASLEYKRPITIPFIKLLEKDGRV